MWTSGVTTRRRVPSMNDRVLAFSRIVTDVDAPIISRNRRPHDDMAVPVSRAPTP